MHSSSGTYAVVRPAAFTLTVLLGISTTVSAQTLLRCLPKVGDIKLDVLLDPPLIVLDHGLAVTDSFTVTDSSYRHYAATNSTNPFDTLTIDRISGELVRTGRMPPWSLAIMVDYCDKKIGLDQCIARHHDNGGFAGVCGLVSSGSCAYWKRGSDVSLVSHYACQPAKQKF